MSKKLVYDTVPVESVRTVDDNGYLHVGVSNISKEQVAPYLGEEIPEFEKLGLKPDEIYKVYRPASELSKRETVESLNGIPILLKHAPDSAAEPAANRVGSTGTDAKWEPPYLTNSLHIQDADAIARINDGTMKEISMGYFYTPVLKSGAFEGEEYDIVMTDITCNHVALVEEGRAGHDVVVNDHALNTNLPADGGQEDKTSSETKQENDMDKEQIIAELLELAAGAGLDPEVVKAKLQLLAQDEDPEETTDEENPEQTAEVPAEEITDEDLPEKEETTDEDEVKEEEKVDFTSDAEEVLKSCGLDADDPVVKTAFQKGFAEGTKYGEEKEKEEPEKLDREHESEGEKKALGEDSASKIGRIVREQLEAKYDAIEETSRSLGKVRASAFDSAADVYRAALKAEGVSIKGLTKSECRTAYRALMAGRASGKYVTMDHNSGKMQKDSVMGKLLSSIKVGE